MKINDFLRVGNWIKMKVEKLRNFVVLFCGGRWFFSPKRCTLKVCINMGVHGVQGHGQEWTEQNAVFDFFL